MFEYIRTVLFKKALHRLLTEQQRSRKTHTLESARTIGVLFDATADKPRQEVLDFVKTLEKRGKKVQLLGFFNVKQPPAVVPDFPFFFKKETHWTGRPKAEKADAFAKEKFEVLLALNPSDLPALIWLAAQSQASMKIGFATEQPNDLDLQLETPPEKGIRHFTEQLERYLDTIVLSKNESAKKV
jgi:hypothetical protein